MNDFEKWLLYSTAALAFTAWLAILLLVRVLR